MVHKDGTAVICPRTPQGSQRDLGPAGFLHKLHNGIQPPKDDRKVKSIDRMDFSLLAKLYQMLLRNRIGLLVMYAQSLGVYSRSLTAMGAGYSAYHCALTFPMYDAKGKVIGIRLRNDEGRKWCIPSSKSGVFQPAGQVLKRGDTLIVCEGPTDAAACYEMGLKVIGRPDCRGGADIIADYCRRWHKPHVRIIIDRDAKEIARRNTWAGAMDLKRKLRLVASSVTIYMPPPGYKDVREWLKARKRLARNSAGGGRVGVVKVEAAGFAAFPVVG